MTQGGSTAALVGRPRSEEAHRAILDAALELLALDGYSALTVEGVAARAGVAKATIYRRWPSKLPLAIEAFRGLPGLEEIDTGDLAADLKGMLREYLRVFHATPLARVLPSLVGERSHSPELSELFDPVLKERRRPLVRRLRKAVARGEMATGVDVDLAADLLVGWIAVRLFFTGARVHVRQVDPLVELALAGLVDGGSGA